MKKFGRSGIGLVVVAVMMMGCVAGPKNIPSRDLVSLFKEFLLVNAYATDVLFLTANDSVDIYTPVLDKYGYSIDDFEYTISNLTKRKSAQISDIMEVAIEELRVEAESRRVLWNNWEAMVERGRQMKVDTIFTDTLLNSKTVGEEGMRWNFTDLQPGSYRVEYEYAVTPRTDGERVYAEVRNAADSTHIINQWALRNSGDTVSANHLFTLTEPAERVFILWKNRGNTTKSLHMWVDTLRLSYTPADTIAIRLMEESLRYDTDYSNPEEVVGRYLLSSEAFDKLLEEQKAEAAESAEAAETSDTNETAEE